MKIKGGFVLALAFLFFIFLAFAGAFLNGLVLINIGGLIPSVLIDSPQNTTYNFNASDTNYTLDFNVSFNDNASSWWYSLTDLRHSVVVQKAFVPNTTINAYRWSNLLVVYTNNSNGEIYNKSVTFFIYVPNSSPIIANLSPELHACEGSYFSSEFNVITRDEDFLSGDISPKNPFFILPAGSLFTLPPTAQFYIVSGLIGKSVVGIGKGYKVYSETISVSDGEFVDSKQTNITIIEINNAPQIDDIGVQTVWASGDNSTWNKQVLVNDIEDGSQNSGNLSFNATFSGKKLFNISDKGAINFTASPDEKGVNNVSICVTDKGLSNPYSNISLCGQNGSPITSCDNFSITITDENRAPTIISYYPENLSFGLSAPATAAFNASTYDPDGTVSDVYWYVDGVLIQKNDVVIGSLSNSAQNAGDSSSRVFTYYFPYYYSGIHNVTLEITDGILNDSVNWKIYITPSPAPSNQVSSGGGGGGGPVLGCAEKWVCFDWNDCMNANKSLALGILSGNDYRDISKNCTESSFKACGFQIRSCTDLNSCNSSFSKPKEIQACDFVSEPSCKDGVKNCHDGSCELLIDCGGPCSACPTCSDRIQNQGEEGVDCGGPCPKSCKAEIPGRNINFSYIYLGLFFVILVVIIIKLVNIKKLLKIKKGKK